MALELGEFALNSLPCFATLNKSLDRCYDGILIRADLSCAVTLAQGNATVLDSLEVHRDTKGRAKLVVSAVPLADGGRGVVNSAGDARGPQLLGEFLDMGTELRIRGERNDQNLGRGNGRGEGENLSWISQM